MVKTPLWVHVVGAAIAGAAFVALFLAPEPRGAWTFAGVVLLIAFDRLTRRLRPKAQTGPIPRAYIILVVVVVALVIGVLAGGWYAVDRLGVTWVAWVAGVVIFASGIAAGILEDRVRTRTRISTSSTSGNG